MVKARRYHYRAGLALWWVGAIYGRLPNVFAFITFRTCGLGVTGVGVFMGEYQTFRTFRTSDQNFLKKMRFTY